MAQDAHNGQQRKLIDDSNGQLDIKTLEGWLWEAACKIRGEVDAPKYKDYILPLIFLKRLSDVFEDEVANLAEDEFGDSETALSVVEADHSLVRFYVPSEARWPQIAKQSTGLGEYLTDAVRAVARENGKLEGVIDVVDFNASAGGQRVITDEKLKALVDVLGRYRLGMYDVEPDIIGRAYEYLLRKFAEGAGSSAGEFYTPREVAVLMARVLDPEPGESIYDPCCGSGGLLIKCQLRFTEKYGNDASVSPLNFYGQELLHPTYAMAKMNAFIHFMETSIALGDTMHNPQFVSDRGSLETFDVVTANPMWNQDFDDSTYENDPFNRFTYGYPPSQSADWGWIQHMHASLTEKGHLAVVLDTGAVSRGSGNTGKNRERDIRKAFVEHDLIEAVILLPENLFYNTSAPGIILIVNKDKQHQDEVLLINGSHLFEKGRPKNYLTDEAIKQISEAYLNWEEHDGLSRVIPKSELVENDYNLSPSRYVVQEAEDNTLPLEDAVVQLQEAEAERQEADEKMRDVLKQIGVEL